MNSDHPPKLVILLVEDNPADVAFFTEALQAAQVSATLHVVATGEDALRFMRQETPYSAVPRPRVIVLDLNLPVKSGREVLADLRAEPGLNRTPVTVLTSSASEEDVCDGYTKGRCRYFVKTGDFKALVEIVRTIVAFAVGVDDAA